MTRCFNHLFNHRSICQCLNRESLHSQFIITRKWPQTTKTLHLEIANYQFRWDMTLKTSIAVSYHLVTWIMTHWESSLLLLGTPTQGLSMIAWDKPSKQKISQGHITFKTTTRETFEQHFSIKRVKDTRGSKPNISSTTPGCIMIKGATMRNKIPRVSSRWNL